MDCGSRFAGGGSGSGCGATKEPGADLDVGGSHGGSAGDWAGDRVGLAASAWRKRGTAAAQLDYADAGYHHDGDACGDFSRRIEAGLCGQKSQGRAKLMDTAAGFADGAGTGGHGGWELSVLVSRRPFCRVLCRWEAEED